MNRKKLLFLPFLIFFAQGEVPLVQPLSSYFFPNSNILSVPMVFQSTNYQASEKGWPIDTLKNDDGTPERYLGPPNIFFLSRLSPAQPCTLLALMFAKRRGLSSNPSNPVVAGCSLLICRDTLIDWKHYPGERLFIDYFRDSLPAGLTSNWFVYEIFPNETISLTPEEFWVGYKYVQIYPPDTLHPLADEPGDHTRNAYSFSSNGPWNFSPYNFFNRAIVKYEEVDVHDIEVLSVGNSQGFFLPNPGNAQLSGIITNSGTVDEPTVTVACTVYTEAGVAVANWSQSVGPIGVNETLPVYFSPNWTPNTDGVYHIVVRSLLPSDMRPNNDGKIRETQVCSLFAELRYDDNDPELSFTWYFPGNGWANKFTPPYYPCQLLALRFYFSVGGRMVAWILDDDGPNNSPGTILYYSDTTTVSAGTFNTINLYPPLRIDDGSFYVAYIQTDTYPNSPALGVDRNSPLSGENWEYFEGVWKRNLYYGDWLIRALIERIEESPSGWEPRASPNPTKPIKGGGGIAARGDSLVFLIPGNNTLDFLKYSANRNSWISLPSVPIGPDNKKVKKGAYIFDTDRNDKGVEGEVYIFKGSGTQEFYLYDPIHNRWELLPSPGFMKGVKGGFGTFVEIDGEDYIYAGSGSRTDEWKRYKISSRNWEAITPFLPGKAKVGSALAWDGDKKIYFLRAGGKTNEFYCFDLINHSWTRKQDLPLNAPNSRRKRKVKEGGCLEYWNGAFYAVKGGNSKELWTYSPLRNSWQYLGEVGNGQTQKGIKCGRSLTSTSQGIYCIIGNNTNEFWFYGGKKSSEILKPAVNGEVFNHPTFDIKPNPTKGLTNVSYKLPKKEKVIMKIYNILGELISSQESDAGQFTIQKLPAGIYLLHFETLKSKEERKLIVVK